MSEAKWNYIVMELKENKKRPQLQTWKKLFTFIRLPAKIDPVYSEPEDIQNELEKKCKLKEEHNCLKTYRICSKEKLFAKEVDIFHTKYLERDFNE